MMASNVSLLKRRMHDGRLPALTTVMAVLALGAAPALAQESPPYYKEEFEERRRVLGA